MERKIIVNATQTKKDSMFIVQPVIAHCTSLHESKTLDWISSFPNYVWQKTSTIFEREPERRLNLIL